jgi:hypothetical protein
MLWKADRFFGLVFFSARERICGMLEAEARTLPPYV